MAYMLPRASITNSMDSEALTQAQIKQNFSRLLSNVEEHKKLMTAILGVPIGRTINFKGIEIHRLDYDKYYCHKY